MKTRVVGKPAGVDLEGVATTSSSTAESVIVFVRTLADVEKTAGPLVAAAREDRIACVSGVRQVAIDDVWSAMRFRPKGG
jgi:hypothetical protein